MAKLSKISVCMLCALMSASTVLTACTAAPSGGEDNTGDLPSGQEPSGGDDGTKEEETWEPLVPYVNTLAGNVGLGATIAGPTMPNGSVHPSPETQNPENGGKSEVAPLGERVFLGTYDFRNATAGNPDVFEMAIGSGKAGTSFTVDYIRSYAVKEDA